VVLKLIFFSLSSKLIAMAGEPSTYDTLERMTRDMENQEAISLPQRRLASTANNRIQLTKPKQTQPNDTKGKNTAYYDPLTLNRKNTNDTLNLIDKSFEHLPPTRRRTVQIKEIMAPQEPTENINHNNNFGGIDTHSNNRNEINRKRLAANEEEFTYLKEPRLQDPVNTYHTNEPSWNRHQYEEELRKAREQLQEVIKIVSSWVARVNHGIFSIKNNWQKRRYIVRGY